MYGKDTIAAIATPVGQAGVGMIRVSGPEACAIARRIFRPSSESCRWESHRLYHGDIVAEDGRTILDEGLAALMHGPHSFTGEDVLEINCHGNPLIMQMILQSLLDMGCRPARPGEFSQRAFFNHRMDLSQAEALAGLVSAQTEQACKMGLAQLKGALGREIEELRLLLIDALAELEATVDFGDDISHQEKPAAIPPQIGALLPRLQRLAASYAGAKRYTEGIRVVITGKPNVGKSSLLNSLLGRKRAIVTDIPGTTRDLITDTLEINGIPVHLTDTAGIRKPQGPIEKEGIDLAWENLSSADAVILLLDGSKSLTDEDRVIISGNTNSRTIVAVNKTDLPSAWDKSTLEDLMPPPEHFVRISAKFGEGLTGLKNAILACSGGAETTNADILMITNLRHKLALEGAIVNIERAADSLARGLSPEFAAFDLHEALNHLDEITGKKISEEILDKIFSSFCIGK